MKNIIEKLPLESGGRGRFDCPACGGQNTLIVSKVQGVLSWYCFRASCGAKGAIGYERTVNEVRDALRGDTAATAVPSFTIPPYWTSPLGDEDALRYLQRMHCLDAYGRGLADIRFDPTQRRLCFVVSHRGVAINAAGRSLDKNAVPKWFIYCATTVPFICGESDTAVLVEDCASACAVSHTYTGVALLGTHLKDGFLEPLSRFKKLYVVLDRDAAKKGVDLQNTLRYFVDASVRITDVDLKYLSPDEIREIIEPT